MKTATSELVRNGIDLAHCPIWIDWDTNEKWCRWPIGGLYYKVVDGRCVGKGLVSL